MPAVTAPAPHDGVDANNPNHPRNIKGWPLSSSGYDPGPDVGWSWLDPPRGHYFVRGCGAAFVRPRGTTVPKVGKASSRGPFAYPNQLIITAPYMRIYIFVLETLRLESQSWLSKVNRNFLVKTSWVFQIMASGYSVSEWVTVVYLIEGSCIIDTGIMAVRSGVNLKQHQAHHSTLSVDAFEVR